MKTLSKIRSTISLVAAVLFATQATHAQICGGSVIADFSMSTASAQVGDIITNNLVEVFSSPNACTITNGRIWIVYPDNSTALWLDNITLAPNSLLLCPGDKSCPTRAPITYLVKASDVGRDISFQTNFPSGYVNGCGDLGQPNTIQFAIVFSGNSVTEPASAFSACQVHTIRILNPTLTSIKAAGPDLILSASGGTPNQPYVVLTSADMLAPTWAPVLTNHFGSDGFCTFSYRPNPNEPKRFFRLMVPPSN